MVANLVAVIALLRLRPQKHLSLIPVSWLVTPKLTVITTVINLLQLN